MVLNFCQTSHLIDIFYASKNKIKVCCVVFLTYLSNLLVIIFVLWLEFDMKIYYRHKRFTTHIFFPPIYTIHKTYKKYGKSCSRLNGKSQIKFVCYLNLWYCFSTQKVELWKTLLWNLIMNENFLDFSGKCADNVQIFSIEQEWTNICITLSHHSNRHYFLIYIKDDHKHLFIFSIFEEAKTWTLFPVNKVSLFGVLFVNWCKIAM